MDSSAESSDGEGLPSDLSALMDKLKTSAALFRTQFNSCESEMKQKVSEFQSISADMRGTQSKASVQRTAGALTAAIGGALAAPFTGGLSLVAAAAAVGGVVTVVAADSSKSMKESEDAEKVKKLGKELMKLVRPLKRKLLEIKTMCEKLDEDSAEGQADAALKAVAQFQSMLREVKELRKASKPEKTVGEAIIQAADQSRRLFSELAEMKEELGDFTEE